MAGCATPGADVTSNADPSAPQAEAGAAGPRVVIDGRLDDWPADATQVVDPEDAPAAPVDIRRILVTDDGGSVYLQIDLGHVVNVQGLAGSLTLLADADDDPRTGVDLHGLGGADLAIEFTRQAADDPGRVRDGIQVRPLPSGVLLSPYDVGLWFEPRHSARVIEVRLERGRRLPDGRELFGAGQFHAVLVSRDLTGQVRETTARFTHEFRVRALADEVVPTTAEDPLARAPGTDLRVVVWNVSRRRMLDRPEPFARILAALAPDIVLLDEVPPAAGEDELRRLLARVDASGAWSVTPGVGGGTQRGAVASRYQNAAVPSLERIRYPDSTLRWTENARTPGLADVERNVRSGEIPALGVAVQTGSRQLLAVTLDLVCCGNRATAPQDQVRRIEAGAIRDAVSAVLDRTPFDAVLVGGDFNLVGSQIPLDELSRGIDPGGGDLAVVGALQLDGRSAATWHEDRGPFPPGQLDYLLYSSGSLEVRRAFVFDSRDLSSFWLERYGVRLQDSTESSDHFPVVADFRWLER